MLLGYITNGLANVDAVQADRTAPFDRLSRCRLHARPRAAQSVCRRFRAATRPAPPTACANSACGRSIETGARFLLDPQVKHEPTLVSADPAGRARRVDFLCRAVDAAAALGSDCVSLWSGIVRDGAGDREAMDRLVGGLLDSARLRRPQKRPARLRARARHVHRHDGPLSPTCSTPSTSGGVDSDQLRLTIDVGHLHCQGELPIADKLRQWADRLVNVHIEDMRAGVHEHLMFGEGEIDFPPVIAALAEIGYAGMIARRIVAARPRGPPGGPTGVQFSPAALRCRRAGG